ncbi:MAG: fumarylacetoacetate hydrolase family protein [Actinomycetota bacterium]|nr:fumarylacetoacetate hydrolase family protein [Actinomycetota bacterium]
MRIYRYEDSYGEARIAVAVEERPPIDLVAAWMEQSASRPPWLSSTKALIEAGPEALSSVRGAVAAATTGALSSSVRWLCPFDAIASLRDFLSFEDHVLRGAARRRGEVPPYWYEAPVYYKGNHRAILGPGETCEWPSYTDSLDFELELALVIAREGRDVGPADAAEHVFGFTIFNDFSARDIQAREMSAWLGPAKGKDFANAFGPCIVTADEVGVEPDLAMICRVNGEEWGRARSSAMRWKWRDIIAHVSRDENVWAADVLGSGTPGGCCGLDVGRSLQPGDMVELEIERIGVLRNPIGLPAARSHWRKDGVPQR